MGVIPALRFVVVGAGHIGQKHIQILRNLEGAELVSIVESNPDIAMQLQADFAVQCFLSWEDFILSGISADVVSVCTPNYLHALHTLEALQRGHHVVCEKPLALSAAEGKQMLRRAKLQQKHLFCMQQLVYSPALTWLKSIIASGALGKLYQVQVNALWNRDERYYSTNGWRGKLKTDGGPLFTQFSHFLHTLYWLFGDISVNQAHFYNFRTPALTQFEDSGHIMFTFKNDGIGNIQYSTAAWDRNIESTLLVLAEKGSIKLTGQYLQHLEYCHIENLMALPELLLLQDFTPASLQKIFFQEVVEVVNNIKPANNSAAEGLKVVKIIEQIYALR